MKYIYMYVYRVAFKTEHTFKKKQKVILSTRVTPQICLLKFVLGSLKNKMKNI